MFERLSNRAVRALALASHEAQRLNHDFIGTEHILLGIVAEGSGVAAAVLNSLGVDLAAVRPEVEKLVKSGSSKSPAERLPQTPRAKKVVEYALEECRRLNSEYVGTEHLLLGILREGEGIAAEVLRGFGVTLEQARNQTLQIRGQTPFRLPEKLLVDSTAEMLDEQSSPFIVKDDRGIPVGMFFRREMANEVVERYNRAQGGGSNAAP